MFSIKIAYRGKNILLPKGTDSIKKIEQEMTSRFPEQFLYGVVLSYQGNIITGYEQIEALVNSSGIKSIKLEAQQAEKKMLEIVEEEKKSEITEKSQPKQIQVPQTKVQEKIQAPENIQLQENQNIHQVIEEVKQSVLQVNISIDSMSSQQIPVQNEEDKQQIQQKKEQIKVQNQHEPQIVKCEVIQEPQIIKCTIFSQIPQNQTVEPNFTQTQSKMIQQNIGGENNQKQIQYKPQIFKCTIFGKAVQNDRNEPFEKYFSEIKQSKEQENNQVEQIQPGVYKCLFCKAFQSCNVCDSKRMIDEKNKFFKFVNKIVQKKISQKLVEFQTLLMEKIKLLNVSEKSILNKVQKEDKKLKKTESKFLSEQYAKNKELFKAAFFQITDSQFNKKSVLLDEKIDWTFTIKTQNQVNQLNQKIKTCLIEQRSGETILIDLKNQTKINLGPYKADKEGKFEKTYRLCIMQSDGSLQLFGPKFGFSVNVTKQQLKKVLSNSFRKTVEQYKNGYKVDKSTEYLVERLKQMGINEDNYQQNKQILPDIICTL